MVNNHQTEWKNPDAQTPSGPPPTEKEAKILPQEIPFIILKAIKIIIDAVSSDKSHIGDTFTALHMPTKFKMVKEIDSPPKSNKPKDDSENEEEKALDDFKEVKGEFLHNFHGYYRKNPGQYFAIQVIPVNENPEVEQIPGLSVEVWWNCTGPKNEIYAFGIKEGLEVVDCL